MLGALVPVTRIAVENCFSGLGWGEGQVPVPVDTWEVGSVGTGLEEMMLI